MNLQEQLNRIQEMMNVNGTLVSEDIDAQEAHSDYNSLKTIVDGKRDVAYVKLTPILSLYTMINGLKKIKVPISNNSIVYKKGSEDKAKELLDIANKYGGYLRYDATEEDSRRIGQLLGYKESDIEDYIQKNKEN